MHILESYAADTRLKIDKPYIYQKYYPPPAEKYITVHQDHQNSPDVYDYWSTASSILLPHLEEEGIKMIQIGSPKDLRIKGCLDFRGKLSIGQQSYVIARSLVHLCSDCYSSHLASSLGKKIVCLFSFNHPCNSGPYWSNPTDTKFLTPDFGDGELPTYAPEAELKQKIINTINPEDVAGAVCEFLNLKFQYPYESLYIGDCYKEALIEHVPNCTINIEGFKGQTLYERMDLLHNENCLDKQIAVDCGCKFSIITKKPIDINIIKRHKSKIETIFYRIDENHSLPFVKELQKTGVSYCLCSRKDKEFINNIKVDYMDYGVINRDEPLDTKEIKLLKNEDINSLYFSSNKFIISDQMFFPNISYYNKGINVPAIDTTTVYPVEDVESFLWDTDYVRILRKA